MIARHPGVVLVDFAKAGFPVVELAGADADPGEEAAEGDLSFVGPGANEIDDVVAAVVRHPTFGQISPSSFFGSSPEFVGKNYGFLSSVPRVLRLFCGLAGPLESAIGILRLISRSIACKSSIGSPISRWKSPTNSGDEAKKKKWEDFPIAGQWFG